MADLDWQHVAISSGVSIFSGVGGLLFGIWKWGRRSAQHDQSIKDDYAKKIEEQDKELRDAMAASATSLSGRLDMLVDQFKESFTGLRRQIDDDRFNTEKHFVRKDDFKEFREEYREDMRDLKTSISILSKSKS